METRRQLLGSAAGLLGTVAGCTGTGLGGRSETDRTPAATAWIENARRQSPACGDVDADRVVTLTPDGKTVTFSDADAARAARRRIRNSGRSVAREAMRVRSVTATDPSRGALEVDAWQADRAEFRDRFGGDPAVRSIRDGRSLATIVDLRDRVGSYLRSVAGLSTEEFERVAVVPEPPAAASVAVLLRNVGDDRVLRPHRSFEVRVVFDDGERPVLDATDVRDAEVFETQRAQGVRVAVSDAGAEEFTAELRAAGALDEPDAHPMRAYFRGERIFEGALAPSLAESIRSGEWAAEGELQLQVDETETARRLADAVGSFQFPADLTVSATDCD